MMQPPYTTKLALASRKALLEALNEIVVKTASDTAVWAAISRKTKKVRFWYAPAQCKKTEKTKEDFLAQFEGKMASKILTFVEQGYIG